MSSILKALSLAGLCGSSHWGNAKDSPIISGFPWFFYGFSMVFYGFPWFSMVFGWFSVGFCELLVIFYARGLTFWYLLGNMFFSRVLVAANPSIVKPGLKEGYVILLSVMIS